MKKLSAILMLLVCFVAGCRKETQLPTPISTNGKVIAPNEQVISAKSINSWFAKNPAGAYLNPDWANARQAIVGGVPAVTVPLSSISNPYNSLRVNQFTNKTRALSTNTPNAYKQVHAPAIYFFRTNQPDSIKAVLLNFVPDDPAKEYGENNVWTGKLVEWNFESDSINVQVLSKSFVQTIEQIKIEAIQENSNTEIKANGVFEAIWNALKWVVEAIGYAFQVPGYYNHVYHGPITWCNFLWGIFCGGDRQVMPPTGSSGGNSGVSGGYYLDVVYSSYVNGYNGFEGGGGTWGPYPIGGGDPCGGGNPGVSNIRIQQVPGGGPCNPVVVPPIEHDYEISGPLMTDTYTDPEGHIYQFSDVYAAFESNPQLVQLLEDDEQDEITFIPDELKEYQSAHSPILTAQMITEAAYLKVMHPKWPKPWIMAVAWWNVHRGIVHFSLDLAGLLPGIGEGADLINGAIYYLEGDKINCALSVASALPVVGWVSTGGKWVKVLTTAMPVTATIGKNAVKVLKVGRDIRFVKVSIDLFSYTAFKTAQLVKPTRTTLTNIGRTIIDKVGIRIASNEPAIVNLIEDIVQHGDNFGTKSEDLADLILQKDGFVKHNSKIGSNNGFDGVYIKGDPANPTEIIINEAKQMGALGNVRLNGASQTTGLPPQMSDRWIDYNITLLTLNADPTLKELGYILQRNRNLVTKSVTTVDKTTKEVIIIKLANYD